MFSFAILIAIYSYLIFAVGLLGLLFKNTVLAITLLYLLFTLFLKRDSILKIFKNFKTINLKKFFKDKETLLYFLFFILTAFINLIGALGPEYAFDALWYHLTLPKIYLLNHSIFHIPGNLLYYSDMPRFGEMLYAAALSFQNEILAKIIHFGFGILSSVALYKVSRKFLSSKFSFLTVLLFYSNLVVGWESTTAYVDLFRTFFEIMAFWGLINWFERSEKKWLTISSLMLGFAISVKVLAIGSLFIFAALILYKNFSEKKTIFNAVTDILIYGFISVFSALPWFISSFINTRNPIYPIFSDLYKLGINILIFSPLNFMSDIWNLFTKSSDPISPLYLVIMPFSIFIFKTMKKNANVLFIYSILAIVVWYITPRTGGGRFLLPYLPVISILTLFIVSSMKNYRNIYKISISLIIFFSIFSIFYRAAANARFIPVILGFESKNHFLENHLNFSFGDFYDTDRFFQNNIKTNDKVLLYGFHNLYYVNFPFIDSSFVKKGDSFNYIAVQNANPPARFKNWSIIYTNPKTKVKVYSDKGKQWIY